jgi:hypothetical protein
LLPPFPDFFKFPSGDFMNNGLISKIFSWGTHPTYSGGTSIQWAAGLVLVLMLAVLWTQVINQVVD